MRWLVHLGVRAGKADQQAFLFYFYINEPENLTSNPDCLGLSLIAFGGTCVSLTIFRPVSYLSQYLSFHYPFGMTITFGVALGHLGVIDDNLTLGS